MPWPGENRPRKQHKDNTLRGEAEHRGELLCKGVEGAAWASVLLLPLLTQGSRTEWPTDEGGKSNEPVGTLESQKAQKLFWTSVIRLHGDEESDIPRTRSAQRWFGGKLPPHLVLRETRG
jgi:hypothetical protein